jgi:DNA-binding NarL/FixJ family response regulator
MHSSPLRIAIIDQQQVLIDALTYCLETEAGMRVVCAAAHPEEGHFAVIDAQPDVALLDADIPNGRVLGIAAQIRQRLATTRILFLVGRTRDMLIEQALRLKADGILLRDEPLAKLVTAIRRAAAGEATFTRAIKDRLDFDPETQHYRLRVDPAIKGLTDRQLEILRYLARGESIKGVARRLALPQKVVDNEKFRIENKIGVRGKVGLAHYAIREGLIQPE